MGQVHTGGQYEPEMRPSPDIFSIPTFPTKEKKKRKKKGRESSIAHRGDFKVQWLPFLAGRIEQRTGHIEQQLDIGVWDWTAESSLLDVLKTRQKQQHLTKSTSGDQF